MVQDFSDWWLAPDGSLRYGDGEQDIPQAALSHIPANIGGPFDVVLAQAAPPAAPTCATCNGHGMIGGPSYYAPDEGGVPCPDCAPPAAPVQTNDASVAAIQFALGADQGMKWLSLWNEGEFDKCREEWPEAPEDCYIGADPLLAAPAAPATGESGAALRPTDDELWDRTLSERDRYHEIADDLAAQIAAITGVEIGEHSSANDPWQNAMLAADDFIAAQLRRLLTPPAESEAASQPGEMGAGVQDQVKTTWAFRLGYGITRPELETVLYIINEAAPAPSLRAAANLAYNALHECKPLKGAEQQVSNAIQALHEALRDIPYGDKYDPSRFKAGDDSVSTTAVREVREVDMARQLSVASVLEVASAQQDERKAYAQGWRDAKAGKHFRDSAPAQQVQADAGAVDKRDAALWRAHFELMRTETTQRQLKDYLEAVEKKAAAMSREQSGGNDAS